MIVLINKQIEWLASLLPSFLHSSFDVGPASQWVSKLGLECWFTLMKCHTSVGRTSGLFKAIRSISKCSNGLAIAASTSHDTSHQWRMLMELVHWDVIELHRARSIERENFKCQETSICRFFVVVCMIARLARECIHLFKLIDLFIETFFEKQQIFFIGRERRKWRAWEHLKQTWTMNLVSNFNIFFLDCEKEFSKLFPICNLTREWEKKFPIKACF